jgi:predicted RNA-binding Zn-ribbon protein involved in translation (DUF1610 family)
MSPLLTKLVHDRQGRLQLFTMTNMVQCQNCGQANAAGSQFCRFCGTRFLAQSQPPPQTPPYPQQQYQPPRPYAWKTDEFQTQNEPRRTQPGVLDPGYASANSAMAQQPGVAPFMSGSYRCPNCMSQFLPRIEKRISTGGWITFALLLVLFFPLFWIGLLIKEEVHVCPSCNMRLK